MNKVVQAVVGLGLLCFGAVSVTASASADKLPRVKQELVKPPFLPKHDQVSKGPKVVEVRLTTEEKLITIDAAGTKVWALTFNGSVPGPLIVVNEGDYVEVTLVNPKTSTMAHNADFHAAPVHWAGQA